MAADSSNKSILACMAPAPIQNSALDTV